MATFGLTPQGFLAKRFEDIVSDISEDINTEFGIDINSDPDNKIKIMLNILALPLAQNWSSVQALQAAMDIDQATDIYLDMLCAAKLIYREPETFSTGTVLIYTSGEDTLTLPVKSSFYDINNNEFTTEQVLNLNSNSCQGATITVDALYTGDITFSFAGNIYSRNVTTEGDLPTALSLLRDDLISNGIFSDEDITLTTTLTFYKNSLDGDTPVSSLNIVEGVAEYLVIGFVDVAYILAGDYVFKEDVLITPPPFTAIVSFNSTVISGGRFKETDEELRQRFKNSSSVLGNATPSAIKSKVLSVEGVTQVNVIENDTIGVDSAGRPPKSVEIIVQGGDDTDVAQKIYDTVAAGIETYGNTTIIIDDVNGDEVGVKFSKVVSKYIWVKVDYTKYSEEDFPLDGEDQIKQAVTLYINSLSPDVDVINGRVGGNIFANVSGLESVVVTLFGDLDPNATPVYQATPVRIGLEEEAYTTEDRVTVEEVI